VWLGRARRRRRRWRAKWLEVREGRGARNGGGVTNDGRRDERCSLRLAVHASLKEEERTALDGKLRGLRERRRAARLPTHGSGAPTATVAGMAGEQHRVEHRRSTISSFE